MLATITKGQRESTQAKVGLFVIWAQQNQLINVTIPNLCLVGGKAILLLQYFSKSYISPAEVNSLRHLPMPELVQRYQPQGVISITL